MGYRHSRDDILQAAVQVALDSGLGGLTFRTVGRRLQIPDRTVVYYFPSKDDLVAAVLERSTAQLRDLLLPAQEQRVSASVLLQRSWDALRSPAALGPVRVYLESAGLAAQGREPHRSLAAGLIGTWTTLVSQRLSGDPSTRVDRAHALVATLDGLLLLRAVAGDGPADSAARGFGLTMMDAPAHLDHA